MDREAEHQAGRTRGGLCHGHGAGDRAAAPAGPGDLSHTAAPVHLDDEQLAALKDELLYSQPQVRDDTGRGLLWTEDAGPVLAGTAAPVAPPAQAPLTYTPPYLAEKILTSRSALEGERKQVTVLFADLKGSMELLAERDPEEARQLLDPVLESHDDRGPSL